MLLVRLKYDLLVAGVISLVMEFVLCRLEVPVLGAREVLLEGVRGGRCVKGSAIALARRAVLIGGRVKYRRLFRYIS